MESNIDGAEESFTTHDCRLEEPTMYLGTKPTGVMKVSVCRPLAAIQTLHLRVLYCTVPINQLPKVTRHVLDTFQLNGIPNLDII